MTLFILHLELIVSKIHMLLSWYLSFIYFLVAAATQWIKEVGQCEDMTIEEKCSFTEEYPCFEYLKRVPLILFFSQMDGSGSKSNGINCGCILCRRRSAIAI